MYAPDRYKTQRCDKVVLEDDGMLKFIRDFPTDNYSLALESVSDCYKTEKCVIKLVNLSLCNTICSWLI